MNVFLVIMNQTFEERIHLCVKQVFNILPSYKYCNPHTLFIIILAFCQERSRGIFPFGESKTITAEVTFTTAGKKLESRLSYLENVIEFCLKPGGGDPKDFNSVKFALFRVFRACWAATKAGSAFLRSSSQSFCFVATFLLISLTFEKFSQNYLTNYYILRDFLLLALPHQLLLFLWKPFQFQYQQFQSACLPLHFSWSTQPLVLLIVLSNHSPWNDFLGIWKSSQRLLLLFFKPVQQLISTFPTHFQVCSS